MNGSFEVIFIKKKPVGLKINNHILINENNNCYISFDSNKKILTIKDEDFGLEIFENVKKEYFLLDNYNKINVDLYFLCIDIIDNIFEDYNFGLRVYKVGSDVKIIFIESIETKSGTIHGEHYNKQIYRYYKIISSNISNIDNITFDVSVNESAGIDFSFEYKLNESNFPNDIHKWIVSKYEIISNFTESAKKELYFKPINIYCEGKTDYIHLKSALRYLKRKNKFKFLTINFCDNSNISGNVQLIAFCKNICLSEREDIIICIFDDDDHELSKKIGENIRYWKNNVYSILIPSPIDRDKGFFCIELYYDDDTLNLEDKDGRKIYLKNDFDEKNGFHRCENVFCLNPIKNKSIIVDNDVIDISSKKNVALSKSKFAEKIFSEEFPFDDVNFDRFEPLFILIEEIKLNKHYGNDVVIT